MNTDVKGSGRDLLQGTIPTFCWGTQRKTSGKPALGPRVECRSSGTRSM